MLAERGLVISAGKMSGPVVRAIPTWSSSTNWTPSARSSAAGVEELLIPEPDTVAAPPPAAEDAPRRWSARRGRFLPRRPRTVDRCRRG